MISRISKQRKSLLSKPALTKLRTINEVAELFSTSTRSGRRLIESGVSNLIQQMTLATLLSALERPGKLADDRRRDLRSAVRRVAELVGDEPAAVALDLAAISARLNAIDPLAVGITAKRLANIRSDFMAAARYCGVKPIATGRKGWSPEWRQLFKRLAGRRSHFGLSRLAGYASARGIEPRAVNDDVIAAFIAAVPVAN